MSVTDGAQRSKRASRRETKCVLLTCFFLRSIIWFHAVQVSCSQFSGVSVQVPKIIIWLRATPSTKYTARYNI
jgi:uncharacterized protein YaeQ